MSTRPPTNAEAEAFRAGGCPFCRGRSFREGPRGGAACNWDCLDCGAVLNVGPCSRTFWPELLEIVAEPTRVRDVGQRTNAGRELGHRTAGAAPGIAAPPAVAAPVDDWRFPRQAWRP